MSKLYEYTNLIINWLKNPIIFGVSIGILSVIVIFIVNSLSDNSDSATSPLIKSLFGGILIGVLSGGGLYFSSFSVEEAILKDPFPVME